MLRMIVILFFLFFGGLGVLGQNVADIEKRYPKIEFFEVTANIKMSVDSVRGYACRLAYEPYSTSDGGREVWINDPGMDPDELVNDLEEFVPQTSPQNVASSAEIRKIGANGEVRRIGWRTVLLEAYYFRPQKLATVKRDAEKLKGLSALFPYEFGPNVLVVYNGRCHDK